MQIPRRGGAAGFTLIELSIVLVIIGLIVGGVLTGQDLIRAAEVRATISQIERYNTAVNTFYGKYDALPGDLNQTTASQFGFSSRGSGQGEGDGNGVIQGCSSGFTIWGLNEECGETAMFWVDLSTANGLNLNLIDGSFSYANPMTSHSAHGTLLNLYFPQAKLGRGNYIYITSGGNFNNNGYASAVAGNGLNYFTLSALTDNQGADGLDTNWTVTVQQAYNIDKKMDDGYPMTGGVVASISGLVVNVPNDSTDSATTCFNTATSAGAYSLSVNSGAGPNCGLLFRFQ